MASKKKDLEIIYNLQWKNKPANGGDKANIIGMYDIPATTLNWEIFKSYLLKNSGTVGDDVKVSYITDSNREFPIESQTDFQIALYAFRRKARMGDIVNLKLDRISEQPTHKNIRHSNDVETQFDNNEAVSLTSCCNIDTPPDWFITYMNQFKKNIADELTVTVSNIVSNIKPHTVSQPSCYHGRKFKAECPKRIRKLPTLLGETSPDTKDIIKSLKLEGKLERKLEKLEHKTKKIKEKKLALLTKSSDSDAGPSSSRSHQSYRRLENEDDLFQMDAAPVNTQTVIPHMLGGEVYLHQWEVMNTGKLPWTSKTTLNFTWGSKALKPLDTIISVPYLKPGDTGILAVRLQIPNHPGQYECYWHFHHKERRFGHWLGCQVIVDPFDLKGAKSVLETSFMSEFISNPKKFKANDKEYDMEEAVTQYSKILPDQCPSNPQGYTFNIEHKYANEKAKHDEIVENDETSAKNVLDKLVRDISTKVESMKLQEPTDTNCSSDSDNQSILSLSDSCSSKSLPEEFVVVPIPDCFKVDSVPDLNSQNIPEEQDAKGSNDIVTDAITCKMEAESNKQASEDIVKLSPEQVLENYDDNNNTEETNQNPSVSGSASTLDGSSCDGSQKSDIVIISLPNEKDQDDAGYAYVIIDGHKLQIPKRILKSEYLTTAGGVSSPKDNLTRTNSVASSVEILNKEEEVPQLESIVSETQSVTPVPSVEPPIEPSAICDSNITDSNNELLSHCSAVGSTYSEVNSTSEQNSRLFIFPQSCPGYEVLYHPLLDVSENSGLGEYKWLGSDVIYPPLSYSAYQNIPSAPLQPTTTASSPPLNLSTHDRNPFITGTTVHVPNYQQTPPNMRTPPEPTVIANSTENITTPSAPPAPEIRTSTPETTRIPKVNARTSTPETVRIPENSAPIHILPETLVSGAVNVASSAINTARSVINMIVPREQPGRWVNGHWVSTNLETPREGNLQALAEMGFWNRDLNATLLARYNDDLSRVVAELVQ